MCHVPGDRDEGDNFVSSKVDAGFLIPVALSVALMGWVAIEIYRDCTQFLPPTREEKYGTFAISEYTSKAMQHIYSNLDEIEKAEHPYSETVSKSFSLSREAVVRDGLKNGYTGPLPTVFALTGFNTWLSVTHPKLLENPFFKKQPAKVSWDQNICDLFNYGCDPNESPGLETEGIVYSISVPDVVCRRMLDYLGEKGYSWSYLAEYDDDSSLYSRKQTNKLFMDHHFADCSNGKLHFYLLGTKNHARY